MDQNECLGQVWIEPNILQFSLIVPGTIREKKRKWKGNQKKKKKRKLDKRKRKRKMGKTE